MKIMKTLIFCMAVMLCILKGQTAQADDISYQAHVQDDGWQDFEAKNGGTAGTTGQWKRLEALKIKYDGGVLSSGTFRYCVRVDGQKDWQGWKRNNEIAGTTGQSRAITGIKIEFENSRYRPDEDVFYRVHVASYGWLAWTGNGKIAGLPDENKRVEAIEIVTRRHDKERCKKLKDNTIPTSSDLKYFKHYFLYNRDNFVTDYEQKNTDSSVTLVVYNAPAELYVKKVPVAVVGSNSRSNPIPYNETVLRGGIKTDSVTVVEGKEYQIYNYVNEHGRPYAAITTCKKGYETGWFTGFWSPDINPEYRNATVAAK